ncbi:hypothetical protein ACRBEV_21120 [Methylobacterium phyllosphaerae]
MAASDSLKAEYPPILTNPIDVKGEWHAPPRSAALVVGRMREACCSGFRILSDRQPSKLLVENRSSGPPAVWLHQDDKKIAIIFVDVGERAWSQLAYQFGHELGHVVSNSWDSQSKPSAPCQWVEELVVESFSLRGLATLAATWKKIPPFPGDSDYGNEISRYRNNVILQYQQLASSQGLDNSGHWFARNRQALEDFVGLSDYAKAAVPLLLPALMKNPMLLEDISALNLWKERTALPLNEYLDQWRLSCKRIGSAGLLPDFIQKKFFSN